PPPAFCFFPFFSHLSLSLSLSLSRSSSSSLLYVAFINRLSPLFRFGFVFIHVSFCPRFRDPYLRSQHRRDREDARQAAAARQVPGDGGRGPAEAGGGAHCGG